MIRKSEFTFPGYGCIPPPSTEHSERTERANLEFINVDPTGPTYSPGVSINVCSEFRPEVFMHICRYWHDAKLDSIVRPLQYFSKEISLSEQMEP